MTEKIWLSPPHMSGHEQKYIQEAFDTNWIAPVGPHLKKFEMMLAEYNNIEHVAALSSGTAAIHLALIMLGVKSDDEVICSSFTFSASANPICYLGAKPVFVDSEPETWNMDPELLKTAIESRVKAGKKPKAIILVHLYGMPAHLEEIIAIAKEYEIPIIEDAAEALGSTYKGKKLGGFGDIGIYSFNGNKIITTSGGGALVSENPHFVEQARFLSTQARDPDLHYQHSQIGYNYRLSNVSAAIGCGQMEVIESRVGKRRDNYQFYLDQLGSMKQVRFLPEPADYHSNRWLTCITLPRKAGLNLEICQALGNVNIEARPLWKPLHLQPVFAAFTSFLNGVSEELFNTGLCLPSGSNLKEEDRWSVISLIKDILTP